MIKHNKYQMPCYRRGTTRCRCNRYEFYNGIVRFVCHSTAFLLVSADSESVKKWQVPERMSQIAYLTQTCNHVITLNYYRHYYSPPTTRTCVTDLDRQSRCTVRCSERPVVIWDSHALRLNAHQLCLISNTYVELFHTDRVTRI